MGPAEVAVYSVVIDLPWSGALRKRNGLAFKWRWPSGKKHIWFGDANTGRNLSIRTSFAKVVHMPSDSEASEAEAEEAHAQPVPTSDKEDPWAASDLLHGLSESRKAQLRLRPTPRPAAGSLPHGGSTLDCALNPWLDMHAPLAWPTDIDDEQVNSIRSAEHKAQRSLMHRFDIAASFVRGVGLPGNNEAEAAVAGAIAAARAAGPAAPVPRLPGVLMQAGREESKLLATALWLRFTAARLLVWNHNYNVKPREISAAQEKLTAALTDIWLACPWARRVATLALGSVGRGGDGNQGQRIRDEILSIQSRNHCKGGMMEQWHQKLHNNSSPDDVVICRALLAYLDSGLDVSAYWAYLHSNGIDAARLASYDRSITQEPSFTQAQVPQLRRDLQAYLVTLCAVHGGHDLHAAALTVLGYSQVKRKGRSVQVEAVAGIDTEQLRELVQAMLLLQQGPSADAGDGGAPSGRAAAAAESNPSMDAAAGPLQTASRQLQLAMAARRLCAAYLQSGGARERARDVLFLDMALSAHARTTVESSLDALSSFLDEKLAGDGAVAAEDAATLVQLFCSAVENFALLQPDNDQAAACRDELAAACATLEGAAPADAGRAATWALHVLLACMQRLAVVIAHDSSRTLQYMQPTCSALASALKLDQHAAGVALEDSVRGMPDAPAAALLAAIEPRLRRRLGGGAWRLVAAMPGAHVTGRVHVERSLGAVQDRTYDEPAVLVVDEIGGDEDLPRGCVAVLCRQQLDVLSHAALRARATGAFVACCSDAEPLDAITRDFAGQQVQLRMDGDAVACSAFDGSAPPVDSEPSQHTARPSSEVVKPPALDSDRWVVEAGDNMDAHVGSKCVNLWRLSRALGRGVAMPPAVALPYACLEYVLGLPENGGAAAALSGGHVTGAEAEATAQQIKLPDELRRAVAGSLAGIVGHEVTAEVVEEVLRASVRVWASKWGERAVRAARLLDTPLSSIHMSVVLQPLVDARMAFVSHSRDPRGGARGTRMYVEAVSGLGESLVGNVAGRPLAFTADPAELLRVLRPVASSASAPALRCLAAPDGSGPAAAGAGGLVTWLQALPADVHAAAARALELEAAPGKLWAVVPRRASGDAVQSDSGPFYGLIARSASNMEDLSEFSGAGVFDSYPTAGVRYTAAAGADMQAEGLRGVEAAMMAMVLATVEAEVCLDEGEQDVEGVLDCHGTVHVVQARPQV